MKLDLNKATPDEILSYLKAMENAIDTPLLDIERRHDFNVQILPDKTVSLAMFKPHPLIAGAYKAHPQTILALKKDIFTIGEDIDELATPIICESCHSEVDIQFWHFCPFCTAKFKS